MAAWALGRSKSDQRWDLRGEVCAHRDEQAATVAVRLDRCAQEHHVAGRALAGAGGLPDRRAAARPRAAGVVACLLATHVMQCRDFAARSQSICRLLPPKACDCAPCAPAACAPAVRAWRRRPASRHASQLYSLVNGQSGALGGTCIAGVVRLVRKAHAVLRRCPGCNSQVVRRRCWGWVVGGASRPIEQTPPPPAPYSRSNMEFTMPLESHPRNAYTVE
jgi:hypothetical protein